MRERIVLAYSGDVASSVAIPWLLQNSRAEVVTVTLDLGQGRELEEVRERALAAGAARAHVFDMREEFARDFILPTLQAGALCLDGRPMASALSRPLIAKTLVEVARIEQARSVAHGSDGFALETLVHSLALDLRVVATGRESGPTSGYANQYARRRPLAAPEMPALLEIAFEQGVPASINGVPMPLTELIESLGLIAGQHGAGRIEWTGPRHDEMISRIISEAPAAQVLHATHADVEALTLPADLAAIQRDLRVVYADLVHAGRWFTPLREALDAFHQEAQSRVTGVSRIELFKGRAQVIERTPSLATSNILSAQEGVSHA